MLDESFQTKHMDFEKRRVGDRGEKVNVQVVNAVGGDGQVVGLGQSGDFEPGGDTSADGDVRFGEGDLPVADHMLEFVERTEILAGGDGHATFTSDLGVSGVVVGDGGLLEPVDVVFGKGPSAPNGFVHTPSHIRIDHQGEVGS